VPNNDYLHFEKIGKEEQLTILVSVLHIAGLVTCSRQETVAYIILQVETIRKVWGDSSMYSQRNIYSCME
jgi:hypothetical protein